MQFDLIRLNLIERSSDLFTAIDYPQGLPLRETWLRQVFSEEVRFGHEKQPFHYVPDLDAMKASPDWIIGRIGRRKTARENKPPEDGMKETEREAWHAMRVIIDPAHHTDGQKVAIERDSSVAGSFAAFRSLAKQISNRQPPEPYTIEPEAIYEASSFWDFVDKHPVITSVTFEFLAPNMFGLDDDYAKDRAELKANENSDRTKVQLNSKDGLKVHTALVNKAVDSISKGTGKVKARSKYKHTYDSEDQIKSALIPEMEKNMSWNDLAKVVVSRIFRI